MLLKNSVGKKPQSGQVDPAREGGEPDKTGSFMGGGGWLGSADACWSGSAGGRGVNNMCNKTCNVSICLAHLYTTGRLSATTTSRAEVANGDEGDGDSIEDDVVSCITVL
jgi:hypothetical protein